VSVSVSEHTRTPRDLEWFGPPERNTLCPLFMYCSSKILSTELEEASVYGGSLPEKGLRRVRIRQVRMRARNPNC
jgi:hypothetical protein